LKDMMLLWRIILHNACLVIISNFM